MHILSMAGYYYPFRTFLCHPDTIDSAINNFVEMVHGETKAVVVQLGRLQASDDVCEPLEVSFKRKKWKVVKVQASTQQFVALPSSVDTFRSSLSRNLRKNHDRRKRNLEAMDGFEIGYYNNCTQSEWEKAIDQCSIVESRCWLSAEGQTTRVYEREQFWKSYASKEDGSNHLSIWTLLLDSKPIAYTLSIDSGNCRYSISGQYDEEYKKYGVGVIVDMLMFENAIDSGLAVVNMGEDEYEYKRRWGAQPGSALQTFYMFRPSVIGLSVYAVFLTLDRLRKIALFSWLNRFFN